MQVQRTWIVSRVQMVAVVERSFVAGIDPNYGWSRLSRLMIMWKEAPHMRCLSVHCLEWKTLDVGRRQRSEMGICFEDNLPSSIVDMP